MPLSLRPPDNGDQMTKDERHAWSLALVRQIKAQGQPQDPARGNSDGEGAEEGREPAL